MIGSDFAALLPLDIWVQDENGAWVLYDYRSGEPDAIVYLAYEQGVEVSLAEVEALLSAADVTEQEWPVACERLGLRMVQQEMIE